MNRHTLFLMENVMMSSDQHSSLCYSANYELSYFNSVVVVDHLKENVEEDPLN